jgi:RNA-directed DNA polymerase
MKQTPQAHTSLKKLRASFKKVASKLKYRISSKKEEKVLHRLISDLQNNQYKPDPLKIVQIPKKDGGVRELKIPSLKDKVLQRNVADRLNKKLNPLFSNRSYGYRPKKTAHQAVNRALQNVKKYEWVLDLDIANFFDNIPHQQLFELLEKYNIRKDHQELIKQWLSEEPTLVNVQKGVPQGSSVSPILANLYLHEFFDSWMEHNFSHLEFVRYADDIVVFCENHKQAKYLMEVIEMRLKFAGLSLNLKKSQLVYCRRNNAKKAFYKPFPRAFQFLGFTIEECYFVDERKLFVSKVIPRILIDKKEEITQQVKQILKLNKNTYQALKVLQTTLESKFFYFGKLDVHFRKKGFRWITLKIFAHYKKFIAKGKPIGAVLYRLLFFSWLKKNTKFFFIWKKTKMQDIKEWFAQKSKKQRVGFVH